MVYETIFSTPLGQTVLAFLLMFTLVFAILQKSEILGKGKKQIDALVALSIGLIFVAAGPIDFVQKMIPFMATALVVILVFLILLSFLYKEGSFDVPGWLKVAFGIIIFIAVVIAVLLFTQGWDYVSNWLSGHGNWGANIVLVIAIIVAVVIAYFGAGKSNEGGK